LVAINDSEPNTSSVAIETYPINPVGQKLMFDAPRARRPRLFPGFGRTWIFLWAMRPDWEPKSLTALRNQAFIIPDSFNHLAG